MNNISTFITICALLALVSCRKSEYPVTTEISVTDNGTGTGNVTWSSKNTYILEGLVFVNDGQVLTIEPGTVIRGRTGQGELASALIVTRGGKINAQGTPEAPIIFTCEGDDLEGSIPIEAKGLWGGIIILGNAPLNASGGEAAIEGIAISEPRGIYGGEDALDDSGILEYVSIRHGGTNIGLENEINGLTLGGVGSNTIIHHIEVISNADDGVEIFGGTVNIKYVIAAFCGDDAFDLDMGYRGKGQFWLAIQNNESGNEIIEIDGSTGHLTSQPYTRPEIYNLTGVGKGNSLNGRIVSFATNAAGVIHNSIFINQKNGISLQHYEGLPGCIGQWQQQNLQISYSTFWNVAENTPQSIFVIAGDNPGEDITNQWNNYFSEANNSIADPGITVLEEKYNLFPITNEPVYTPIDSWFDAVNYRGAFGSYNWTSGWSLLFKEGYLIN